VPTGCAAAAAAGEVLGVDMVHVYVPHALLPVAVVLRVCWGASLEGPLDRPRVCSTLLAAAAAVMTWQMRCCRWGYAVQQLFATE
jgi:hypothetical protein